jgi:hypothetical protein
MTVQMWFPTLVRCSALLWSFYMASVGIFTCSSQQFLQELYLFLKFLLAWILLSQNKLKLIVWTCLVFLSCNLFFLTASWKNVDMGVLPYFYVFFMRIMHSISNWYSYIQGLQYVSQKLWFTSFLWNKTGRLT